MKKKAVVDFDGVLHLYKKWMGFDVLNTLPPKNTCTERWSIDQVNDIWENIEIVRELHEKSWYITIFTTRLDTPSLRQYLYKWGIPFDEINTAKNNPPHTSQKPIAHLYLDDRAVNPVGKSKEEIMEEIRKVLPDYLEEE